MERRAGLRPQLVLVADDHADTRELWAVVLRHHGFIVDEARDGAEAVRKAIARQPALVLMDVWMPVIDGLTATAQLKADPRTAGIPVLALSAQCTTPGPTEVRAAGADEFLEKPCDLDALIRSIRSALHRPPPTTPEA
jgi:CheY-like chemotaxis protein